jgi:hypothetical protein
MEGQHTTPGTNQRCMQQQPPGVRKPHNDNQSGTQEAATTVWGGLEWGNATCTWTARGLATTSTVHINQALTCGSRFCTKGGSPRKKDRLTRNCEITWMSFKVR